jgi:CHASE3 domain sensor protein
MKEIALARINSFAPAQANVPSSEEPIFVLTGSQLQEIIARATKPIQDRLDALQEEIALERAYDRQRIAKLEHSEPQPLQRDRGEILRALIAANGGKMLAKDARQMMHLSKQSFTNLLSVVDGVESRPYRTDKRQRLLVLE